MTSNDCFAVRDSTTTTDEYDELKKRLTVQMTTRGIDIAIKLKIVDTDTTARVPGSTTENLRVLWEDGNTRCEVAETADKTRFKMEGNEFKKNEMTALLAITRVPDCMDRTRLYDRIAARSVVEFDKWNAGRYMYSRKEWKRFHVRLAAVYIGDESSTDMAARIFRDVRIQYIVNLLEGMDVVQLAKSTEYHTQAAEMRELWVDTMSMVST